MLQVLDLLGRDAEAMGQMTCQVKKARWVRILDAVRLAPAQQDALLLLRQQHLAKLHDVYSSRQSLNLQVQGRRHPPCRGATQRLPASCHAHTHAHTIPTLVPLSIARSLKSGSSLVCCVP